MTSKTFFPRGSGPLISFLLPTRKRCNMLAKTVDSIYSLAVDKSLFEFIFKIDNDDIESIILFNKFISMGLPVRGIISPRGEGYKNIHIWVNQMASVATGDWILVINDDMLFTQEGWDQGLLTVMFIPELVWHGCKDIVGINCKTFARPDAMEFPIIRKRVFDVLGHVSLNAHCDNWISTVLSFVGSMFGIELNIIHFSDDVKDDVRKDVLDVYPISGRELNSPEQMLMKANDVSKLLDYISNWQQDQKNQVEISQDIVITI